MERFAVAGIGYGEHSSCYLRWNVDGASNERFVERYHSEMVEEWPSGSVEERVIFALAEVRPAIQADGGDVELVSIDEGTVSVKLTGACQDCPMARSTLSDFVGERIQLYCPEITDVVAV